MGFYRRFIRRYASIANPLTQPHLVWSSVAQTFFQQLKDAISSAPVLQLPNFEIPFTVETNVSGVGMGASQSEHPIGFFNKQFCLKLRHASTYVRELATLTTVVKKWRQYLLGRQFIILTNHRSLKEIMAQVI